MKILLILLSILSFTTHSSVLPNEPHIYVEGYAEVMVFPDQLKITVSIVSSNFDASIAKTEVDKKTISIFNVSEEIGILKKDVTSTPIQISPAYEYEKGEKIDKGTRISRKVDIVLKDLQKYSQFNNLLIASQAAEDISSVVELKDERKINKQTLMLALKDAKLKAAEIADLQGKKIKDVYSISEFKIREENSFTLVPHQWVKGQSYSSGGVQSGFRPPPPPQVLEIGKMTSSAKIFVVYTME